jgi:two-component system, NarL family, nitrate/nitrite response regulator NarL
MRKSVLIRILLAERQPILRSGLSNRLNAQPDMDVVASASTEDEAAKLASESSSDILVLDSGMGALLNRLFKSSPKKKKPHCPGVVILASESERAGLSEMLNEQVRGVALRENSGELLIRAIRSVSKGMYWVVENEVLDLAEALRIVGTEPAKSIPRKTFGLTSREIQVTGAIVLGYSNTEIALSLKISEATVKHHVTNIFDKVGVHNRLELALFAMGHGLVRREEPRE